MSAPIIFNGRRAKMLTQDGILRVDGSIIDNDGVPNLIKNGHAEINVTGWTVSKNTVAASRPDSGFVTSGTNITWTRNTTNPIDGQADFLYTKDAANRQGEQAYYGFTVSKKYRAKVLQIEVDYLVNSGTFSAGSSSTDSDVIVYIYDVTNSTFIEPSSFKFLSNSSTIADKFIANFQTSATGSSYRILFHQATTSASAFAVQFKEVRVSPCQYVYGTPITDWISYTPTFTGFGTTSNNDSYWRRVGDSIELSIKYTVGTPTATEARVSLPSGLTFGKFGTGKYHLAGRATRDNTGSSFSRDFGLFAVNGNSYLTFSIIDTSGTSSGEAPQNGSSISVSGDDFVLRTHALPIAGWSSSTQVSDGYDARGIVASYTRNANTTVATSATDIVWNTAIGSLDLTAMMNTSTGVITFPSSGQYEVAITARIDTGGSAATQHVISTVGTGTVPNGLVMAAGTDLAASKAYNYYPKITFNARAGDTLKIQATSATNSSTWIGDQSYISIAKIASPTTISATEVVAATYQTDAAQSLTSAAVLKFEDKVFDTHNAYNTTTGVYTAPVQGLYAVSFSIFTIDTTTGQDFEIAIRKNSSNVARFHSGHYLTTRYSAAGTYIVSLLAGETIDIYNTSSFAAGTLYSSGQDNFFSIQRIK